MFVFLALDYLTQTLFLFFIQGPYPQSLPLPFLPSIPAYEVNSSALWHAPCHDMLIPLHRLNQSWILLGCEPGWAFSLCESIISVFVSNGKLTNINTVYTFSESLPIIPESKCFTNKSPLSPLLSLFFLPLSSPFNRC